MRKWANGVYQLINPGKYVGLAQPRFRSGWEHAFFRFCDTNDAVLQWASESIRIPYRNPVTGKMSSYIPDIFMTYRTKDNLVKAEIVEIKPRGQSMIQENMNSRDRAVVAVNHAKWHSATLWAKKNGVSFRVVTEDHLFRKGRKKQ